MLLPRREGRVSILEEFLRRFAVFEQGIMWWNEVVIFEIGISVIRRFCLRKGIEVIVMLD